MAVNANIYVDVVEGTASDDGTAEWHYEVVNTDSFTTEDVTVQVTVFDHNNDLIVDTRDTRRMSPGQRLQDNSTFTHSVPGDADMTVCADVIETVPVGV